MSSISFRLKDDGVHEYKGVAYFEDPHLVLEIQRVSPFGGAGDPDVLKVEFGAFDDVRFVKKLLVRDRISIMPKNRDFFKHLPKAHRMETELVLKTKRKERELAIRFTETLEDKILFQRGLRTYGE